MNTENQNKKDRNLIKRLPHIAFGLSWLIVLPAGIWGVFGYYLPLMGGTLDKTETWIVALLCLVLAELSLSFHLLAHLGINWVIQKSLPAKMAILIYGDASQLWAVADTKGQEILIAFSGPVINLLIAVLAFLVWNSQANNVVGITALFISGFNGWLFLINLIPAFPLDGGRIFSLLIGSSAIDTTSAKKLSRIFGLAIAVALTIWGLFLFLQHSRFSLETGLITFLLVILLLDGLKFRPLSEIPKPVHPARRALHVISRAIASGLLSLIMLAAASSLLLTNDGLDAPGVALSIGPMVVIPQQYQHSFPGQYFLVTVISQAPITAGEWVLGQFDPAIQIVPPEQITPNNTTPQKQAQEDYQMLNDSETTAIAVGLRLAGYKSALIGKGVLVEGFVAGSLASDQLQVGDIIIGLDGIPIQTTNDLVDAVKAQTVSSVHLVISRGEQQLELTVPLMPPANPSDTPKLGIEIQSAGYDYHPPFPISIETNKISGGPSAGLMFTLTVYNSLTPTDLTGGRRIAGTGTISLDGSVGPIGGVKQKIFAAEAVGATYFLCPVDNYADAVSVAKTIHVVKIGTVAQALAFLRSLPSQ